MCDCTAQHTLRSARAGPLHALTTVSPEQEPPIPITRDMGGTRRPFWTLGGSVKIPPAVTSLHRLRYPRYVYVQYLIFQHLSFFLRS